MLDEVKLKLDYPASIAQQLIKNELDMGLVPVAVIPQLKKHFIIGDYGICCDGAVASVCLFSEVPLEEVEEVLMDYQSRTSVRLARILLQEHWKVEPKFTDTRSDYRQRIKGTTAGVVIGDRALEQRLVSPYIYDLGAAWKAFTGLPFVFAAWISNKELPEDFAMHFNAVNCYGLDRLDEVIGEHPFPAYNLQTYYRENIHYKISPEAISGLTQYLKYLKFAAFS